MPTHMTFQICDTNHAGLHHVVESYLRVLSLLGGIVERNVLPSGIEYKPCGDGHGITRWRQPERNPDYYAAVTK